MLWATGSPISVTGQALDRISKLVAPIGSPLELLGTRGFCYICKTKVLFSYKDGHFGCLSCAAAVMIQIFTYMYMESFLAANPRITNHFVCIVRSSFNVEYLKPALVTLGAIGIQLVELFTAPRYHQCRRNLLPWTGAILYMIYSLNMCTKMSLMLSSLASLR